MHLLTNAIRFSLLTLLVVTPWFFGGVWARVQWVLMLCVAMLLAIDLVARFGDEDRPNLIPTAWLPVLAGVALGLFQLIPWPSPLAKVMAPATAEMRAEFAGTPIAADAATEIPRAASARTQPLRRTVYAVATREYLALLILALAVLVLASSHLVDRQSVIAFFSAVGVRGAALSFFGLVQRLSWNGKFYWVVEPLAGDFQSFGPFVNRNNAGGFLNLCVAAGLGLLVWVFWPSDRRSSSGKRSGHRRSGRDRRWFGRRDERRSSDRRQNRGTTDVASRESSGLTDDQDVAEPDLAAPIHDSDRLVEPATASLDSFAFRETKSSRTRHASDYRHASGSGGDRWTWRKLRGAFANFTGDLDAKRMGALSIVGFTAGGVLCTASRGSILALFAASMLTIGTLAWRRGSRGYAVGLIAILVAGVALMNWAGQTDFVRARFAMLFEQSQYDSGRWPNWVDALQAVPKYPVAGSGLGTYPFVYEQYQQRFLPNVVHRHAENQFVQALVEGGFIAAQFTGLGNRADCGGHRPVVARRRSGELGTGGCWNVRFGEPNRWRIV